MDNSNRSPSAHLHIIGSAHNAPLYRTPAAALAIEPGQVTIILGNTISGLPVTLTVTSLEWLDDLEDAIQVARAQGVVQGDMKLAAAS